MFKAVLFLVLGLGFGIWASDGLIGTYRMLFGGEQTISCLPEGGLCVGDRLQDKYIGGVYTIDKIGGLDAIFCEDVNPATIEEQLLLVDDILDGERCEGAIEGFSFRNTTARTVVIVEGGVVSEIRRGALHTLDL